MRLKPPRLGEILAGASGLLLAFSLFLPWYRVSTVGTCPPPHECPGGDSVSVVAFEAFAFLDLYLLVVALAGVGLLVAEVTQRTHAIPVAWASLTLPLALVATGLVLWRTFAPAGPTGAEPVFVLLGLLASAGVAVGALLSMRDEGFGIRPRPGIEATLRGAPAMGGPDPLPAPPVSGESPRERP